MKKLIKKIFTTKKQKLLVHDPIQELIARLCDPTDILYDENFAATQLTEKLIDETNSFNTR